MRVLRTISLLGSIAAVAAVGATSAAAGGDVTTVLYPAVVNVELVRANSQLAEAAKYQDEGDSAHAVASLTAARSHMHKAWIGAKYVIDNAPPPVTAAGALSRTTVVPKAMPKAVAKANAKAKKAKAPAHPSGGAVGGVSPYADEFTTAAAVMTLQDQVAETALGMIGTADATVLPAVSSTLFAALNDRDTAIAYIHSLPAPPAAAAGVHAKVSGGAIVGGWATTMPNVTFQVDDELTLIDNLNSSLKLSPGRTKVLNAAEVQNIKSERNLNLFWPPVPPAA
jgi:hypothetical protein